MPTLVGALFAALAGACFAVAGVLQQRVAITRPADEGLSPRLIVNLARHRAWLAGIALAAASYGLQACALAFAPLSVVQPVLAAEVLFAVPLSVRLHRFRLGGREWAAAATVSGGLAAAIVLAQPRPGNPLAPVGEWAPLLAVTAALVLTASTAARLTTRPMVRAASYAVAAALVVGLESALMAATTHRFEHGAAAGFTAWETYAMAIASIVSLLLIQSAFQAGPLAVSLPIIDAVAPGVAIAVGLMLFGEHVATDPWRLTGAVAALALMLGGIASLASSPVVKRMHEHEAAMARGGAGHASPTVVIDLRGYELAHRHADSVHRRSTSVD